MRQSFGSALGHGILSVGGVAVVGLVGAVVIARLYGVEVVGEFALTLAPVSAMTYLTTMQEQAALTRELSTLPPGSPRTTGLFAAVFGLSFTITAAVGAGVAVAAAWVLRGPVGAPQVVGPMLAQLAGYAVVQNTCWNIDGVLNAFRAGRALMWVRLTQAIAFLAIAVAFGASRDDPSVWGLVLATIGSWAVSLVPRVRALADVMPLRAPLAELRAGMAELPDIIRFGLRAAPGGVLAGANPEAGVWILGVTGGTVTVGAWNRARALGDRVGEASLRLQEVLLPTLVEREAQGDLAGRDRALLDSCRLSLAGLLLPAAALGGAADGVMDIFGPGFSDAAIALALLLLYQALGALEAVHIADLYARDRPGLTTAATVAGVAAGLATAIALCGPFGPTGAAVGMLVGASVSILVMHPALRSGLSAPIGPSWPARARAAQAAAYGGGLVAAVATDRALDGHAGTLAAVAAGTAVYVAAFVLLGGPQDRDRRVVRRLVARVAVRG